MNRLRMRSFVFLICMTVILAALPTSQAMAAKQTAVVTAKQVNVRQGPGTLYHVVMKVDQGETYRVVREKAGWVQLEIKQNQTGWVAQQYIAYVRKQAMVTEDRLRIRTVPSLNGKVVGYLSQGQAVEVIEKENDWEKVVTPSFIGWVSSAYLASNDDKKTSMRQTGWVTANSLNVRARPSLQAERVEKVTYGQQVPIMFKQGQWYQIATENGRIGWVSSEYFAAVSSTASQWVKVLYNDENIRSDSSLDGNIKTTAQ